MAQMTVDWRTITDFVTEVFTRYGVPAADAAICADILLEADRRGIESHGVNRFKPIYLDRIKAGVQNPVTRFEIIKDMNAKGITILLVEQNAEKALGIADRAYVLTNGVITHQGTGAELAGSEEIKKAYLGG